MTADLDDVPVGARCCAMPRFCKEMAMYTLDLDGEPFAVVNLPRHEAEDFFDTAMAGELRRPRDYIRSATRMASRSEKIRLVQAFKERHMRGAVGMHHFDGFFACIRPNEGQSIASGHNPSPQALLRERSLSSAWAGG